MAVAQGSGNTWHGDPDRLFVRAVIASLFAHALIFVFLPGWLDPAKRKSVSPPPLVARFIQPRPAPPPSPDPLPRAETPPEAPRRPAGVERTQPRLAVPHALSPAPATTAAPAPVTDSPKAPETVQLAPPSANAAPGVRIEASSAPPSPAPAAGDAADPATIGQYRMAIIGAARRYKRYPRLALDNNWEGQAEIRMVIGVDGSIASISIKSRSGFEVLDQQALEMIRRAKPLTPIPPALRGRGFAIDVPVVFSLKEETG